MKSILARTNALIDRSRARVANIGRYRIQLPPGSALLKYQQRYERYDVALGDIARMAANKYPDLCAIDIGANVGDTAALIRKYKDVPVLCVEGDAPVAAILRKNAEQFGDGIEIEASFVGEAEQSLQLSIESSGLNASLVGAAGGGAEIRTRSLQTILHDHPRFGSAKLLKIDTEGFDFRIIRGALEWIRAARPIIFFEYDPAFAPCEPAAGLATIDDLASVGYEHFVFYDNFGNYLTSLKAGEKDHLVELNAYLRANRRFGTIIYYFDICAVHRDDADLASLIRRHELDLATGSSSK